MQENLDDQDNNSNNDNECDSYQRHIKIRKQSTSNSYKKLVGKLDLTQVNYDDISDQLKSNINKAIIKDSAMMKQNTEIDHLLHDINNRKHTPRLNYNPINMSFDDKQSQSINVNSGNRNKNEYNFVLYVQDSIIATEINVKFTDNQNGSNDGVIDFSNNIIRYLNFRIKPEDVEISNYYIK